jgi:murein DD-endopeptidase MepM/ murein hydrolase activator NlpD
MNNRFGFFTLLLSFFVLTVVTSPENIYGQERVYVVQRGETFFSIARTLGVKPDDLMKYNGITDPSRLQAGQRLKIPGSTLVELYCYNVVRGDTLYSIAQKFSVTVASIQEVNNLPQNYLLKEGDVLKLPEESKATQVIEAAAQTQAQQPRTLPLETAGNTASSANSQVRWPVAAQEVNYMTGKLNGVVITGKRAEPVNSLTRGTVLSSGPYRGFGKVVIIQVDGGYLYVYGGCENLSVKEGDRVGPGTELGKLGVDAVTNKAQLFFIVYRSNVPIDPAEAPRA